MSDNLQVFSFTKDGERYHCSHPGDCSGDYVPLVQAEALQKERKALVIAAKRVVAREYTNHCTAPHNADFEVCAYPSCRDARRLELALQTPATSRESDGHDAD